MAWYNSWNRAQRLVITVPSGTTAAVSYFPVLLTSASLPTELTNHSYGSSTGADLAFATDLGAGNSISSIGAQIPCEVVSASFGGTPSAEIWVQVPSIAATGTLTYIWVLYGNSGQVSQPAASSTYGSQAVWDENGTHNYVGVYHLNETGTNPTVHDSTSLANNSTAQVWTPTTSGQIGGAGSFTGTSANYVNLPSGSFPSTNNFTVSLWAHWAGGSTYGWAWTDLYVNRTLGSNGSGVSMCQVNEGSPSLTGSSIATGLHHLVMTKSSTTGLILYTDAVAATNSSATAASSYGAPHSLGGDYTGNVQWFDGIIDEVRLAETVRSASWVAAEYSNQKTPGTFIEPPSGQGPISSFPWWMFGDQNHEMIG